MTYNTSGQLSGDALMKQYLPLVTKIAHHMMMRLPPNVDVNDLIQVGLIGLHESSQRFDNSQGILFETYVSQRIRGAMLDDLRANDWVSRSARKTQRDIKKAIQDLEHELGHTPKESEIATKLSLKLPAYHELLSSIQGTQMVYIEDLNNNDEDSNDYLDRHTSSVEDTPLSILLNKKMRGALIPAIENLQER